MHAPVRGRFAPSPSGRMHLGNLFSALLAWLSVRAKGGVMVLRMEDLDPDRCREEYALQLADDLRWLGLDWDEGYGAGGPHGPYRQRERTERYAGAFQALEAQGLVYPCFCTRAERLAASAPHRSDGSAVYPGTCRTLTQAEREQRARTRSPAWRLMVPDRTSGFTDGLQGSYAENLGRDCGDFILRRSDGVYAYQWRWMTAAWRSARWCGAGICWTPRRGSSTCWNCWAFPVRSITMSRCCWRPTGGGCPNGSGIWTWGRCGGAIPRRS